MNQTMIEQIAWVIATHRCKGLIEPAICMPDDEKIAKAVLEKLLTPTQYMISGAAWQLDEISDSPEDAAEDVFKEMIQMALDQHKE